MKELYSSGKSISEIAEIFDISRIKAYRFAKKEGLILSGRKYRSNDSFFSTFTPESCYWAGFIAADGCILNNTVKISLAMKDIDHLELFKTIISFTGNVKKYKRSNGYEYCVLSITSKKIVEDLNKNFNIHPRKTFNLMPPILPDDLVNHYVRGYIDGDGCFAKNRYSISIVGSEDIIKWIREVIINFCMSGDPLIHPAGNVFSIAFSGRQQFNRIVNFLYKGSNENIRLNRKYLLSIRKPHKEEEIIKLYNSGKSINYITQNTSFGYFKVYRILTESKIPIRRTNKVLVSQEKQKEILELRRSGKKIKEISMITGVTNPRVSQFLMEFFIK
jgi:DNA-binding CsgD family transcriptional regulator